MLAGDARGCVDEPFSLVQGPPDLAMRRQGRPRGRPPPALAGPRHARAPLVHGYEPLLEGLLKQYDAWRELAAVVLYYWMGAGYADALHPLQAAWSL